MIPAQLVKIQGFARAAIRRFWRNSIARGPTPLAWDEFRAPSRSFRGSHITIFFRGNNRRRLFSYPSDYRRCLLELGRSLERHRCELNALCLMSNHGHLVLIPPDTKTLSAFMHRFAQRYAVFRNGRRNASGKLFEERFRSKLIDDDSYLATLLPYIDANSVRAGIHERAELNPWCTYRLHAGLAEPNDLLASLWTPSAWWLSLGSSDRARGIAYQAIASVHPSALDFQAREELEKREQVSQPYRLRLERPDRTRAAEAIREFPWVFDNSRG